jgi:hypothetical protein
LAQQKLATETQRTAAAQNQAARSAQALATEQNKTAREAANTAAAQDRAAKSALSLAAAQQRAASAGSGGGALPRTFAGFTPGGLNQAIGAFGLATLGPQIVGQSIGAGVEAGQEALALRETRNALKQVAGDTKTYTTIVEEARKQQLLFGGSLSDLTEGLAGFAVTARNTGAPLSQLLDLQKRLTILNPAQGAQGGLIALNEALAGNITSLSRRFNIPKASLQELNDTAKPAAERLRVLDDFLNKVGITSEAVTGRIDADAQAFRRLNQALSDTKLNAGDQLATAFSGAATGLARLLGLINQNPQAIAELKAVLGRKGEVTQADLGDAARRVAIARTNEQLPTAAPGSQQRITGVAAPENEQLHLAREMLVELNIAQGVAADQADVLTQAFHNGTISIGVYRSGLSALVSGLRDSADVEDRRAAALDKMRAEQQSATAETLLFVAGLQRSAEASQIDAAQKDAQQAKTALLAQQSKLAVDQFLALNPTIDASAAASLAAANGYDPQIQKLIVLAVEARNATNALGALNGGGVTEGRSERDTPQQLAQARTAGLQLVRDQAEAQKQAERDRLNRTGTTAQKLKQAERDVAAAANPQARFEAETKVIELRQQLAREQDKGDRSRVSAAEKALNLEEKIRDSKEAQLKATLDAAAAAIKDRQDRRKEDQEIRKAQRILASGRASPEFQAAARDRIALIDVERQQRALDIAQKQATAGGTIINGKVFQSVPGGGGPVPSGPVPTAAGRAAVGGAPQVPVAGGAGTPIQFLVDGKLVAEVIVPFVVADLHGGLRQAQSAGA